jgi:glycosyltransferase involved in cell wall biosynthesis
MTQTLPAGQDFGARLERAAAGRRRILFAVHSAKLGGAERMALLEADCLQAQFELLLSVPDGPLRSRFGAHGELVDGAATLPLWGASAQRWVRSAVGTLRDAIAMTLLIRRRRVELVLTNSSVCLAPVLAARIARVPVVVHARDVPKSRLAPLVMALHGKLASTVIVIADGLAPYFRAGRRTRLARIADGISVPALANGQEPGVFGSPLRLCLVGALDPRKGQDVAVSALAKLREQGVAATLDLVGRELDEQFAATVREQAHSLGVADEVRFVGEVEDIGPHLDRANIVIAPSRGEWTPLVLMEALARGKPVVATRVGSVAEVVHDRESGLLVSSESPVELADAIVELATDPAAASAMGERGYSHVAANFRVEQTLEGLLREIDLLLERKSVGAAREPGHLQTVI